MADDVFKRKNSPYWQCFVRIIDATGRRKRIPRSTGIRIGDAKSRQLARINAQELQRTIASRPETAARAKKTLKQALRTLTKAAALADRTEHTLDNISYRGATLVRFFTESVDLHDIDADKLREYAIWSRRERSAHTVHRELVVLGSALDIMDVQRPKFPELGDDVHAHKPQRVLELDEQRAFMLAIPVARRLNISGYLRLGLRLSEPWKIVRVDWDLRYVSVQGTKTRKNRMTPREVPIPDELFEMMLPRRAEWPVFPVWHRQCVDFVIRRAGRRAGICEDLSVNDLRGTYATFMARAGVDVLTLSGILGNSPAMLASVYAQVNIRGDHLHAAAARGVPRIKSPAMSCNATQKVAGSDE